MSTATLNQFHEMAEFADRMKEVAYVEMYGRERETNGVDARHLILPPKGYFGVVRRVKGVAAIARMGLLADAIHGDKSARPPQAS
ncbi:hypothetical protein [Pseudomonas mercuritolerans]|uniref:Uncharacterized protein n=1 Tax=Pseudomonas mercuritolerans TaxID=2951809 RepID=A0ABT2Y157_9PSED|nr:hypothetical protein [Pseudomonas mercuritolerans]MCV2223916.1 hypothetical protein [Pseudomonas mercuritolerans]